jgi:hypothetical protein
MPSFPSGRKALLGVHAEFRKSCRNRSWFSHGFLIKLHKIRCFVDGRDFFRFRTSSGDGDRSPDLRGKRRMRRPDAGGDKRGNLFIKLHKIGFFRAESSFAQLSI